MSLHRQIGNKLNHLFCHLIRLLKCISLQTEIASEIKNTYNICQNIKSVNIQMGNQIEKNINIYNKKSKTALNQILFCSIDLFCHKNNFKKAYSSFS